MKVCTDACVFGAWFAGKELNAKNILDVGSGTGLLMLMLAQKQNAIIEGIEIDPSSFQQLQENIKGSKWKERLAIHEGDIRSFKSDHKFDFIISNPPFYEKSLKAESHASNLARHSKELTLEELMEAIYSLLSENGSFGILLPYARSTEFERLATQKKFRLVEKLFVRQSPNHKYFRSILHFSRCQPDQVQENELVIQNESGDYTYEFIHLLKDYYLYLGIDKFTT